MPVKPKKKLQIEERRTIVAANILAGLNYRDIAKALNVSLGTVSRDAQIMMDRMRKEQVQTVGEAALIDLRRIDVAINAIYNDVKSGKLLAIDRLVKLLERRSKMLGYDEQVFTVNVTKNANVEAVREKRWKQIQGPLLEALEDDVDQESKGQEDKPQEGDDEESEVENDELAE